MESSLHVRTMNDRSTNSQHSPPMICDESRRLVLDLALNQARAPERPKPWAHVLACDSCRAAVEDFDAISEVLIAEVEPELPRDNWVDRAVAGLPLPRFGKARPAWLAQLAAAASLVLAVAGGAYWVGRSTGHVDVAIAVRPLPMVKPIAPTELANRLLAFQQVSKAFDNRAGWLLVSDTSSDVGLDPAPSTDEGMLLIRLTVTRRNQSASEAHDAGSRAVVSSANLVILPGRTARVSLPFTQGRVLSYEIAVDTGEPTRLALFAELRPVTAVIGGQETPEREPLAALATTLDLRPGAASPAGSFVTGTEGYEMSVGFSKAALAKETPP